MVVILASHFGSVHASLTISAPSEKARKFLGPQRRETSREAAEALLQDLCGCDNKATPMAQVPELQRSTVSLSP